jgi:hypothetical protein
MAAGFFIDAAAQAAWRVDCDPPHLIAEWDTVPAGRFVLIFLPAQGGQ